MINIEEKKTCKIPGQTSLFISFDYNKDVVEAIKQCDVYNYDKKTCVWEVPVTCLQKVLDSICKFDDITLNILKDKKEKVKSDVKLSKYKTTPFNYQLDAIQYGLHHDSWLLLDAPGLGKTLTLMYLAQELKKRDKIQHCLVICGINTLKSNWKNEIEKHSNLSCMILGERVGKRSGKVTIGGTADRLADLKNIIPAFFVITNIETLRNDAIIKAINTGPNKFDMIILDECHVCKNPTSQQTKNFLKLNKARFRIGATGTLLLNDPADTYIPLKWIGQERANFSTFKYYYYVYGGMFNNDLVGYRNIYHLKDQLESCSLRRTKDLLQLPPKTVIEEYVDMNDAQQLFYENIKQGIIDQVDKVHMSTANLLAMVARLRQATACPSMLTTEKIESSKMDRAVELAKEIMDNGDKVVIFSTFKETLNPIVEKLKHYNPLLCTGDVHDSDINSNIKAFQTSDKNRVMCATWQKMGTGVTLTSASYAIFLDSPWTSGVFEQAQDRIHRIGTTDSVFIYNLICKNTIDERVRDIVNTKEALSDYVVDDKITDKSIDNLRKYILELAQ